ncbi:TPA: hypothetical protein I7730_01745 [Vibrio vulnificus]|uniref:Uncharacterized protein n=1 Tax=Vibrio vulnificus TaxID=672 RepID=A0A8H9K766_VIBVL|nr:PcfJ domain-containing protein [Vibrio vulnificus]HAS8538507.1 hypothetical protein [Vibrio vulnificus]
MKLTPDLGGRIIDVIQKEFKQDLPEYGFLAGQSVCSILLREMGRKKDFPINDFDVFVSIPHKPLINLEYCKPIYMGFKTTVKRVEHLEFDSKNIENLYYSVHGHLSNLRKASQTRRELVNHVAKSDTDRFYESMISQKEASGEQLQEYKEIDLLLKSIIERNTRSRFEFHQSAMYQQQYEITSVSRDGLLNVINLKNHTGVIEKGAAPYFVLNGFDLNNCMVGVDLRTRQLHYTPHFLKFIRTEQMEIVSPYKPSQTAMRYFSKRETFGFYGNDEFAANVVGAVLSLKASSEMRIPLFGKEYRKKFNACVGVKDYFSKSDVKRKVLLTREGKELLPMEKVNKSITLSRLKPRFDAIDRDSLKELAMKRFMGCSIPLVKHQMSEKNLFWDRFIIANVSDLVSEHMGLHKGSNISRVTRVNTKVIPQLSKSKSLVVDIPISSATTDQYSSKNIREISDFLEVHWGFGRILNSKMPFPDQFSLMSKLKQIERIDEVAFWMAETLGALNWSYIQEATPKQAAKHIRSVAAKESKIKDKLTTPRIGEFKAKNGVKLTELTRLSELRRESRIMKHCVRSYGQKVKRKKCMIFTLEMNDSKIATLEVSGTPRISAGINQHWIVQLRGYANKRPSKLATVASKELLEHINDVLCS